MSEISATRATAPVPGASPASSSDPVGKLGSRQLKPGTPSAQRHTRGQFNDSARRLMDRLLNVATPRGVRTEAKLTQCIEDTRSDVSRLLASATTAPGTSFDFLGVKESIAQLTHTMQPMTSRGADPKQLLGDSVKANLRGMSIDEILALHDSIEQQGEVELYKPAPKEQTGESLKHITDRRHFVAVALRDIQAQIKIELDRRAQFDPELQKDAKRAEKVNAAVAKLGKAEKALAAEIADAGPSKIHKDANARLLAPLRQDLPPAAPRPAKSSPLAPVKAKVAQPRADHDARLGVRAKKLGPAPLETKETNAAANATVAKLLTLLDKPGKDPQLDLLAAKEFIAANSGSMRAAPNPGTISQRVFSAGVMVNLQKMKLENIVNLNANVAKLSPLAGGLRSAFTANALDDIQLQISDELKRRIARGEIPVHAGQVNAAIRS